MEVLKENDILVVNSINHKTMNTFNDIINASNIGALKLEINIYDLDTDYLIQTIYALTSELNDEIKFNETNKSIEINTGQILKKYNYNAGRFTVKYKFYEDILGTNDEYNKVFISAISPASRQEIGVDYIQSNRDEVLYDDAGVSDILFNDYTNLSENYFNRYSQEFVFNKFANFGNNKLFLVVNSKNEYDDAQKRHVLILKLYEALPSEYNLNSKFWLISLYSDEIVDTVVLYDTRSGSNIFIIRPPNFSNAPQKNKKVFNTYKSYNDIVSDASNYGLNDIFNSFIVNTSSLYGIDLNIDYSNFKNFVHFGSATQAFQNFKQKLKDIESYNHDLALIGTTSSFAASSSLYLQKKKDELFSKLTRFERFLYFETGSYFTSSLINANSSVYTRYPYTAFVGTDVLGNLQVDATYPKQNVNVIPYQVVPTTSSVGEAWFNTMYSASLDFDMDNREWLLNTVPEYIRLDTDANSDYITFINMVGEFYDNIWTYIENYYRILKRENHLKDGVSSELIWNILKNNGLTMNNSGELVDLSLYYNGIFISGSESEYTASIVNAEKQITNEIWNRLSNNLPYLYKTKGTKRSIQALLNCYGIPTNYVSIIEFGGPTAGTYSNTSISGTFDTSYEFELEDFTHVVNMKPGQYISIPWVTSSYQSTVNPNEVPDSIEFKFGTKYSSPSSQILLEKSSSVAASGSFTLTLNKSPFTNLGYLLLAFQSNSLQTSVRTKDWPFYTGEMYNVLLKRDNIGGNNDVPSAPQNYTLVVKKYDDSLQKITVTDSVMLSTTGVSVPFNTAYIAPGNIKIGSINSLGASASFDEFRLWSETISDGIFDWHSKYSSATNGKTLTSSLQTLIYRLSFNDAGNLGASNPSYLPNEGYASASYATGAFGFGTPATASGFSSISLYPYNYTPIDRYNLVSTIYSSPIMNSSQKIRIENNQITQSIVLPDNYVVRPLRLPPNTKYLDTIFDSSGSNYVQIKGEQSSFDNTDIDSRLLMIAFTPTQLINNDIIAFFGNFNLFNDFGDPSYYYTDSYPSTDYLKRIYKQNTKNHIDFYEYINFIKMYRHSFFEQVKDFIPVKSNLALGTVYEPTLLTRSKVRLMRPEMAENTKQRKITLSVPRAKDPAGFISSNIQAQISDITILELNIGIQNSIATALYINDTGLISSQKIDYQVLIPNTDNILISSNKYDYQNLNEINRKFEISSDRIFIDGGVSGRICDILSDYKNYLGNYEYKFNLWDLKSNPIESVNKVLSRLYKFVNSTAINSSFTTPDRQPAVEINKNSGKQLRVNYSDNPKLIVQ